MVLGKEAKAELDAIKESIILLTETVKERLDNIDEKLNKIDNFDASLTNITSKVEKIEEAIESFDTSIQSFDSQHDEHNKDIEELKNKYINHDSITTTLRKKITTLEKSLYTSLQHNRLSNIEIDGIPANIVDDNAQLEEAAIKILTAINVKCSPDDIEAIHRLPSSLEIKPTIVKFISRKTAVKAFENKNKLKYLAALNIRINGLTEDCKIFIRPSQCPYYRLLAYNCRVLKRRGQIHTIFIQDDGIIKIKVHEHSTFIKFFHETDLRKYFPNFGDFSFDT